MRKTTLAVLASNLTVHRATTARGVLHESAPWRLWKKPDVEQTRRVSRLGDDARDPRAHVGTFIGSRQAITGSCTTSTGRTQNTTKSSISRCSSGPRTEWGS
jgi:hypothetical protein